MSYHWWKITTFKLVEKYISRAARYKNSDYFELIVSGLIGVIIGFFVFVYHETMIFFLTLYQIITDSQNYISNRGILLLPIVAFSGGLIIGILKKTIFRKVTHEGIESVVQALVYKDGKIAWGNSFKSIILSAISIASGGGAGREGPTIVLGASVGSSISQILQLDKQRMRVFSGSGAAAAISAIFDAPLGGIIFAMEAIIGDVKLKSFASLVIASISATATTRILVGNNPLLITPQVANVSLLDMFLLAIAGITSGFVAIYYLKAYFWTTILVKDALKKVPQILKPAIGGLLVGILAALLPTLLESTYQPINNAIRGNGYGLIKLSIFEYLLPLTSNYLHIIIILIVSLLTLILKPISNAITIASGSVGGTFAPSIKAGAMYGFVLGLILSFFIKDINVGLYAIVCAGAVLSGTFQAPLTGGIILFEITHNYNIILPLILSSVLSSFIIQKFKIRTFNALQQEIVDDENRLHPMLKIFDENTRKKD
ncbi:MAG TPA: chloride channel protein [Candidatus Kapabacteria bacterium]|nr:chloride channel protein [Candidatus Kapabacteria bacterium]